MCLSRVHEQLIPLASPWRDSCRTPGGQAPVAVPAVTTSRARHARQREAALGRGTSCLRQVAAVVVPRASSGQKRAANAVHLHMVGQTPKVHPVAAGMLMFRRCPVSGMASWKSRRERRWSSSFGCHWVSRSCQEAFLDTHACQKLSCLHHQSCFHCLHHQML